MATVTFPIGLLTDDSGAILTAPVVAITSVTDKAGTAIASHGATVNGSAVSGVSPTNGYITVDYDAETHGEAIIAFSVSQATHTVTGLNATPQPLYAAKDSGRLTTALPAVAAGANGGLHLVGANALTAADVKAVLLALSTYTRTPGTTTDTIAFSVAGINVTVTKNGSGEITQAVAA